MRHRLNALVQRIYCFDEWRHSDALLFQSP
jgi:hypothetical protein